VIFGAVIDEATSDEVRVTVIATGFGTRQPRRRRAEPIAAPTPAVPVPRREPEDLSDSDLEIPSFLRED
jgi:cell division protein FtsZ